MHLRTLRTLAEVVRQGGFSAAAKAVFATQPTVSKAIQQLEDELGVVLFDRTGHRPVLTAAGEIVHRRALAILNERDDMLREIDDLRGLRRGELRLGLPPLGSAELFASLFAAYRQRYPGVEIRLIEHGSKRLEEILLAGGVEMIATLLPLGDDFEFQPVRHEPLLALLPAAHPLAGRDRVTLGDLRPTPFILFEEGFALNARIAAACQRAGFTPTEAARSAQITFIVALVASGLGCAFLPRMIAELRPHPEVRLVPLDAPGTDWHMALAWRRGGYLSDAARAWAALARDMAG
ncbi:LysR family transcriptional regulator [Zavarzinia compransoris]|uniref:LysR family transcriptional regulator n=1 Tax=Zavarzinia compransoris TaxID=1264899 RepID=A0A317E5G1_9PROT|nr:LysR family transcriptional regulator [Zavarzinia compransoris]PWR22239.1 LysR family transcriptional regulator [Zavarzinia compransoris]TDP47004.1 DNA-binding transcriptional LysR family regulator [Zavarzinia compransoris]